MSIFVRNVLLTLAALAVLMLVVLLSMPVVSRIGMNARNSQCRNKLKQIGLALHNYHLEYDAFPPVCITDEAGKPMHSWRVLIVAYLDHPGVYAEYRFDEPWDGPNNKKLHSHRLRAYECPLDYDAADGFTSYLAVTGSTTLWRPNHGVKISDATDSHDETLLVVEAAETGIHWMEPRDISMESLKKAGAKWPPIGRHTGHKDEDSPLNPYDHALVLSGYVLRIAQSATAKDRIPLFTISGKEDTTNFFDNHGTEFYYKREITKP